jgi:hypothetical protein
VHVTKLLSTYNQTPVNQAGTLKKISNINSRQVTEDNDYQDYITVAFMLR